MNVYRNRALYCCCYFCQQKYIYFPVCKILNLNIKIVFMIFPCLRIRIRIRIHINLLPNCLVNLCLLILFYFHVSHIDCVNHSKFFQIELYTYLSFACLHIYVLVIFSLFSLYFSFSFSFSQSEQSTMQSNGMFR